MKQAVFYATKWGRALLWLPSFFALLIPLYFFHLEKELRFFKKNALSYKKFVEASFSAPEDVFTAMPVQLKNIPFGEKTGVVLANQVVEIRGVSNPYNASIQKKETGGYHLLFRYDMIDENERGGLTAYIGYAELDSNFQQTEKEFIQLDTRSHHAEDPRLLKTQDKWFLIYNDIAIDRFVDNRVMCMAELDLNRMQLKDVVKFDPRLQPIEKNWIPFEYVDHKGRSGVYFEYSLVPLKLLQVPDPKEDSLIHLASSYNTYLQGLLWPTIWGDLRGGTPAQRIEDEYLAFFHSSFKDKLGVQWYCMGAYTFEPEPPFRITSISNYPILFNDIYGTPPMNTADPMKRVIFPAGFVVEEREGREVIQLSCGENDSSVKVVTLDKEKLMKSLKKIKLRKTTS